MLKKGCNEILQEHTSDSQKKGHLSVAGPLRGHALLVGRPQRCCQWRGERGVDDVRGIEERRAWHGVRPGGITILEGDGVRRRRNKRRVTTSGVCARGGTGRRPSQNRNKKRSKKHAPAASSSPRGAWGRTRHLRGDLRAPHGLAPERVVDEGNGHLRAWRWRAGRVWFGPGTVRARW